VIKNEFDDTDIETSNHLYYMLARVCLNESDHHRLLQIILKLYHRSHEKPHITWNYHRSLTVWQTTVDHLEKTADHLEVTANHWQKTADLQVMCGLVSVICSLSQVICALLGWYVVFCQ